MIPKVASDQNSLLYFVLEHMDKWRILWFNLEDLLLQYVKYNVLSCVSLCYRIEKVVNILSQLHNAFYSGGSNSTKLTVCYENMGIVPLVQNATYALVDY